MTDTEGNAPPGWPDVLESTVADAMRNRCHPASFMLEIYDLFDKMEREIRCHRGTFCVDPSRTHEEKP
jgi:hypothetical protein